MTVGYLSASAGPTVFGWLRDLTGSMVAGLWFVLAMAVGMVAQAAALPETDSRPGAGFRVGIMISFAGMIS